MAIPRSLFLSLSAFAFFINLAASCRSPNPADFVIPAQIPRDRPGAALNFYFGMLRGLIDGIASRETPIAIRFTSFTDTVSWNCVASYHGEWKDALTKRRPWVRNIPSSLYTTEARVLCTFYGFGALLDQFLPESRENYIKFAKSIGLGDLQTSIPDKVERCAAMRRYVAKRRCFASLARCEGYSPQILGAINARMTLQRIKADGWNGDGALSSDGRKCTANCRPYTDSTGYQPVNWPGRSANPGEENRWQPLLEDNGLGFFVLQQHVTPHIGKTAVPRLLSKKKLRARKVPDPEYDYELEADLVTDRVRKLSDLQKMTIELMDDKLTVAIAILQNLLANHPETTFEHAILLYVGYTAAEYDSVVLSWKEKVRHDLIRPTTVIQERTEGQIRTWGGPFQGAQLINARDFQPYIRVMPHSEYPSGSGCICQAIAEYTDLYLRFNFNDTDSMPVVVNFPAGSSRIEPGVVPAKDETLAMKNLRELRDVCGQSRLDGGMHFTAAVPAGYDLCEGIGTLGFKLIRSLVGGKPL